MVVHLMCGPGYAVRRLISQWLVDGEVELVMSPRTVTALAGLF